MATLPSPNMGLPVPVVSQEPGPDYASDINNSLGIIDQHNHTTGQGVPVPSAGLNINADLTFNDNNATALRSANYQPQVSPLALPADIGCTYVSGVDLYYNDGIGNQVRITQSGGVAGSPGSIANLASPASASYVSASSTFVWQSAANTAANNDGGSLILRNLTANSKGLTLSPPNAMGADYGIILPNLPASQKIMTLDSVGNMTAPYVVDNSTIEVASNTIQVKALGIGTAQLAAGSVTKPKLAALGQQLSSTFAASSSATGFTNVSGSTVTITTTGRPVKILLIPSGTAALSGVSVTIGVGNTSGIGNVRVTQNGSSIGVQSVSTQIPAVVSSSITTQFPISGFAWIGTPSAGAQTYLVQIQTTTGNTVGITGQLIAYEL